MSQKIAGAFALPNSRSRYPRPTFIFFNSFFWYNIYLHVVILFLDLFILGLWIDLLLCLIKT